LYEIDSKLEQLQAQGRPIQVGLIGAGQMGTDIVAQVECMIGMEIAVVVDLKTETAARAYKIAGYKGEIVETDDLMVADKAVSNGKKVATTNYRAAIAPPQIQAVIDATGSPEMGARITLDCINNKKHIVMMNVECDITIGPILKQMANNAGIVYSLAAGDEPGAIIELYRFAKALGFKVIAAGKGKNNPLDLYSNPDKLKDNADARNMSAKMLCEFVDGSKTMIEMAAVSNATGLIPDIRGMHGPKCNIRDLTSIFCRIDQGGILEKDGVVDYGIGNINPGIFVIVNTDHPRLIKGLVQRDMGNGPNYLLFRPYHLCSIETPITAAQAVIYGESTAHPMEKLSSECITVAKKDLKAGQVLDGIGEYCYRASIELADVARYGKMLPVGLAKGAELLRDVRKDDIITYDMVKLVEDSILLQLRRIQDCMIG
jgi:predicted homoserine dehydrogenase-like protein